MKIRRELSRVSPEVLAEMTTMREQAEQQFPPRVDGVCIRGEIEMVLQRQDGSGLYVLQPNLITNAGFDLLCDVLGNTTQPNDLSHIGIGTSSTAASVTQTSLVSQNARVEATYSHTTGTKVMTLVGTVAAGTGTGTIRESGCFNASSGGTLFNRSVFGAITKNTADSLQVTFRFTFS